MTLALVIGKTGQLAQELKRAYWPSGLSPLIVGRPTIDITDPETIENALDNAAPKLVINAAAYTAVDTAESDSEAAFSLNRDGVAALADACRRRAIPLIHVSTDYVFDGSKHTAYVEEDMPAPASVYGRSKLAGEKAIRAIMPMHVILRTSWVYSPYGQNFLKTMLRLAEDKPEISVVSDQTGCPTSAEDLAAAIIRITGDIIAGRPGIYGTLHYCGASATTWHGFAREIFQHLQQRGLKTPQLKAITTADYPTAATRPQNSILDCTKFDDMFSMRRSELAPAIARCLDSIDTVKTVKTAKNLT